MYQLSLLSELSDSAIVVAEGTEEEIVALKKKLSRLLALEANRLSLVVTFVR